MPAVTRKADGTARQVGVEFELQGIAVDALARLIATTLQGELETVSEAEFLVCVPDQGEYRVEVDYALLKKMAKAQHDAGSGEQSKLERLTVEALSAVSSVIVPSEVVAPPMPMERFAEPIQTVTDAIRNAGGEGTGKSVFYAFGVHLNVEPPNLDAQTIAAYIKAFTCLYDWIVWQGDVDWVRRMTPYIKPYPTDYELTVTDPDYWPGMDDLVADYLDGNSSRNRAMDMLPLFSELNASLVQSAVEDDLVKPRPAFHYRLANCAIDNPEWSVEDPWRRWLQIEYLANDRDALTDCCAAYRRLRSRLLHRVDDRWREEVTRWLRQW